MKRKLLCLLLTLSLISATLPISALAELGSGLQVETRLLYFAEEWQSESSDTHVYLVLPATITNWETEELNLSENISLRLTYADKYEFEGELCFSNNEIEPLVELDGEIVVRVPNMVAAHPENIKLTLTVDKNELALDAEFAPAIRRKTGSFEGPGYDTPEEAVLAYIEAMRENDLDGMTSTFAIETLVENMDTRAYIHRLSAATPASWRAIPADNPYAQQIFVAMAYHDVINSLYYQYLLFTTAETEYADLGNGRPIRFTGDDRSPAIDSFIEAMNANPWSESLKTCEFVEWLDPASLHNAYTAEINQSNIDRQRLCHGADEMAHPCAHIRINGEDWMLLMECVRYGDKWYNISLTGNVANLMGVDSFRAGLIPMDELME